LQKQTRGERAPAAHRSCELKHEADARICRCILEFAVWFYPTRGMGAALSALREVVGSDAGLLATRLLDSLGATKNFPDGCVAVLDDMATRLEVRYPSSRDSRSKHSRWRFAESLASELLARGIAGRLAQVVALHTSCVDVVSAAARLMCCAGRFAVTRTPGPWEDWGDVCTVQCRAAVTHAGHPTLTREFSALVRQWAILAVLRAQHDDALLRDYPARDRATWPALPSEVIDAFCRVSRAAVGEACGPLAADAVLQAIAVLCAGRTAGVSASALHTTVDLLQLHPNSALVVSAGASAIHGLFEYYRSELVDAPLPAPIIVQAMRRHRSDASTVMDLLKAAFAVADTPRGEAALLGAGFATEVVRAMELHTADARVCAELVGCALALASRSVGETGSLQLLASGVPRAIAVAVDQHLLPGDAHALSALPRLVTALCEHAIGSAEGRLLLGPAIAAYLLPACVRACDSRHQHDARVEEFLPVIELLVWTSAGLDAPPAGPTNDGLLEAVNRWWGLTTDPRAFIALTTTLLLTRSAGGMDAAAFATIAALLSKVAWATVCGDTFFHGISADGLVCLAMAACMLPTEAIEPLLDPGSTLLSDVVRSAADFIVDRDGAVAGLFVEGILQLCVGLETHPRGAAALVAARAPAVLMRHYRVALARGGACVAHVLQSIRLCAAASEVAFLELLSCGAASAITEAVVVATNGAPRRAEEPAANFSAAPKWLLRIPSYTRLIELFEPPVHSIAGRIAHEAVLCAASFAVLPEGRAALRWAGCDTALARCRAAASRRGLILPARSSFSGTAETATAPVHVIPLSVWNEAEQQARQLLRPLAWRRRRHLAIAARGRMRTARDALLQLSRVPRSGACTSSSDEPCELRCASLGLPHQ